MVLAGNKAKRFSSVNYATKTIYHYHHQKQVYVNNTFYHTKIYGKYSLSIKVYAWSYLQNQDHRTKHLKGLISKYFLTRHE